MTVIADDVAADHAVKKREVIKGLDTLRFVTALWVAFSHGARFPVDEYVSANNLPGRILLAFGKTMFNGTAAVAVFFLISGFLIHRSNMHRTSVPAASFWIRRGLRIGIPLAAIIAICHSLGPRYIIALDAVLWSVIAEIIYYFLYPLLFSVIRKYSIGRLLIVSQCISIVMIYLSPTSIYLWSFGMWTWLFCAPLWLMGCYLAEHKERITIIVRPISVWLLRLGAIVYCLGSTTLSAHAGSISIGYTWTIWPFGIYCIGWLAREIDHADRFNPSPLFERFGLAGYAIYLTHKVPLAYFDNVKLNAPIVLQWLLLLLTISAFSWAFYRLIEWPSHRLARNLTRKP